MYNADERGDIRRLGVSSTLAHRGGHYSNDTGGSPFQRSAANSGRTSPYPNQNGNAAYGAQRMAEDLEEQNDERLEGLTAKVKLLKDVRTVVARQHRPCL